MQSGPVPVNPDGSWSVELSDPSGASGCRCFGPVNVKVVCKENPACEVSEVFELECEGGCPCPKAALSKEEGDCNQDGTRTVTLTATITMPSEPPPPGCGEVKVQMDFGDGSALGPIIPIAAPPGTTVLLVQVHNYATPGTYTARLFFLLPAGCPPAQIVVGPFENACPILCPSVTNLHAAVSGCIGDGSVASATFTGTLSPAASGCKFNWTFGDEAPGDLPFITTVPTAAHTYLAPGTYAASVTAICGSCVRTNTVVVTVEKCEDTGGGGGSSEDDDEGFGCGWARRILVIAAIIALLATLVAVCVPAAATVLLTLATVAGLVAIIAGIIWYFCPKPCQWGLLLAWQVLLGVGLALLFFTKCCPTFWVFGILSLVAASVLLTLWATKCQKSRCQVLAELTVAVSGIILPLLGWIGLLPGLSMCINPVVAAAASTFAAAIALALSVCTMSISTAGQKGRRL